MRACFCVSEADTRQKLLRIVKKEVGVFSWTSLWSRREVYSPQQAGKKPPLPSCWWSNRTVGFYLKRIVCCMHVYTEFYREKKRGSCSDYLFSWYPALSSLFGVINSAHRWSDMNSAPSEGFRSKLFHTGIITEFKLDSRVDSSLSINLSSVASANHTDHQLSGLNGNHRANPARWLQVALSSAVVAVCEVELLWFIIIIFLVSFIASVLLKIWCSCSSIVWFSTSGFLGEAL